MPGRFQDRLNRAAGRLFVGRREEQALFRQLLTEEEPSYLVLLVHGPGGIGKSSLLRSFQRICASENARSVLLDVRAFGESQAAFLDHLRRHLGVEADADRAFFHYVSAARSLSTPLNSLALSRGGS